MKTSKVIALFLAMVMLLSCMTACGQKQETTEEPDPAPATEPEQTQEPAKEQETEPAEETEESYLPLVKNGEEATLTIGLAQSVNVENYDTNYFTQYIEEKTGINLEFVYFSGSSSDVATQLALMISSGEKLPDILWDLNGVELSTVYEYGEDGYFIDLNSYFDEYSHFFTEGYELLSDAAKVNIFAKGTDPSNGALYAFPEYQSSFNDSCAFHVSINEKWLEEVNAEIPTTVDELYEVLKLFAANDLNGNGENDEIPIVGYDGYRSDISQFLINAFVYCNDEYFFNATDGEVWVPYTTDEYRQALIYLNKLYSEGLLSPLTYTISEGNDSEMTALFTPADGTAIAGVVGGHMSLTAEVGNEVMYEYTALTPLKGETELGGYAPFMSDSFFYHTFITTDCENPVLAFQLLDFLCSRDAFLTMRYGEEGVDWEYVEPGTAVNAYGVESVLNILDSSVYGSQNNKNWHNLGSTLAIFTTYASLFNDDGSWSSEKTLRQAGMYKGYHSMPTPDEVILGLVFNAEENEIASEVSTPMKDYVQEARALFATGVMDPNDDSDWENYLEALENQGLPQYLEIAQAAYSRMNG